MRPAVLAAGVYFGSSEERRVAGSLSLCRSAYAARAVIGAHSHGAACLCLSISGGFR